VTHRCDAHDEHDGAASDEGELYRVWSEDFRTARP
jgi:hypothetical protein